MMMREEDRVIVYQECLKKHGIATLCYVLHLHELEENYEECARIYGILIQFDEEYPEIVVTRWDEKGLAATVKQYGIKNPASYIRRVKDFALDILDVAGVLIKDPVFDDYGIESEPPRIQSIRPEKAE